MTRINASSDFSVNNTRIVRRVVGAIPMVEKAIQSNLELPLSTQELADALDEYRGNLQLEGIPMPEVSSRRIDQSRIIYLCEDGGPNLVELYGDPETLIRDHSNVVSAVAEILRKAIEARIAIDPHIKNFVGYGTDLRYVDFSPPLLDSFFETRCSVAAGEEESILRRNFSYFGPDYLVCHFAGDLLNLDPSADALYPELRRLLIAAGLSVETNVEAFTAKAKSIRALEDLRLQKRIFMI